MRKYVVFFYDRIYDATALRFRGGAWHIAASLSVAQIKSLPLMNADERGLKPSRVGSLASWWDPLFNYPITNFPDYSILQLYPLPFIPRSKGLSALIPSDARMAQPPPAVAGYCFVFFLIRVYPR